MADAVPQPHTGGEGGTCEPPISAAEPDVDIRKPKPWHGLREFLKEYVIIVVGVLTALAGEQAVEWLHWRHVSQQTIQSLDDEVRENVLYAADRLSIRDCLEGRLAELRDNLTTGGGDWKADPLRLVAGGPPTGPREAAPGHVMPIVHGLPLYAYTHQAWDAARAGDALSHLPAAKLAFYSKFYEVIDRLNGWQAAENQAAVRLSPWAYDARLEQPERAGFLADLAAADDNAFYIDQFSRILVTEARDQQIRPDPGRLSDWLRQSRAVMGGCVTRPSL